MNPGGPRMAKNRCCAKMTAVSFKSKLFAAVGVLVLLWFARVVWDYFDPGTVAHQAMQYQLRLFGSAMYEYHSATGQWPASLDDLARTSLRSEEHTSELQSPCNLVSR